jgi:hypothetical protein
LRGIRLYAAIALVALLAAGLAGGLVVAFTDSDGARDGAQSSVSASLGSPRQVRVKTTSSLPVPIGAAASRPGPEAEPNESVANTPTDPVGIPVRSSSFPATELKEFADPGSAAPTDLKLTMATLVNKGKGHVGIPPEPSVAANGDRVLVTWNKPIGKDGTGVWSRGGGVAFSSDGGRTFELGDPETQFPEVHDGFCCDQRVLYVPRYDLWLWLLQYWPDARGNVLRLAVARGDGEFDARRFTYWDFKPAAFAPTPETADAWNWFDFPNLDASSEHAFVASNVFTREGGLTAAVVLRVPLEELKARGRINYRYKRFVRPLDSADPGAYLLPSFARGASTTMYFAQHVTDAKLDVSSWPDDQADATSTELAHSRYRPVYPEHSFCPRTGVTGTNWCWKADDRMATGWVGKGTIGFAWNARDDANNGFPQPFVMVVEIDEATMKTKGEPFIWSPDRAYQYAALAPNARGEVGGVVLTGGGANYQACAALGRDPAAAGSRWDARIVAVSDSDLAPGEGNAGEPRSGDFLGATVPLAGSNTWLGSCMSQEGGREAEDTQVHVAAFGRVSDTG